MVWAAADTQVALQARYRDEADGRRRMRLQGVLMYEVNRKGQIVL